MNDAWSKVHWIQILTKPPKEAIKQVGVEISMVIVICCIDPGVHDLFRHVSPQLTVLCLSLPSLLNMRFPESRPNVHAVLDEFAFHLIVVLVVIHHKRSKYDE